ncbi:hypothetical protein UK15_07835 [Streptomyces variegatus]|uniref:Exonuclease domain-containing protein n=1 Tax=Streptomyces variegatus TaxID=284040 RepID=A0A0M2GQ52_9ACTN|nr:MULTISPECIES: hypothetical protein [Streptomyces]KJK40251.1 hypothetical protein UK15_07835 [Streptomyces variegatus]
MTNIAFVDCETTHLDAEIGEAWEVAIILREQDGQEHTDTEYCWQIRPDLISFDPEALRIGRFEERFAVPPHAEAAFTAHESGHVTPMTRREAILAITNVLSGAVLVGSNPGFDERHLRKLLGPGAAQWHYRPYDIVQLAAAKLGVYAAGPLPWRSHALSRAVGVEPPSEEAAHTALGDARWARDVFDAVMTVPEKFPLSWEGRAKHAIGLYTRTVIELEDARRDLRRAQAELAEEKASHDPRLRCLLIKAAPDRDQYVGWSTSCDMPAGVWSRETALEYGFPASRLDRADRTGTSSHIGDGAWDDKGFIAEQRGWLRRDLMGDYAVEYLLGDREAAYALLEPLDSGPADDPSQPVSVGETPCTCTVGEACAQCPDEQPAEACGKCKTPFDPVDTRFDGAARYAQTPYCGRCVDACHDTEIADHRCVICQ